MTVIQIIKSRILNNIKLFICMSEDRIDLDCVGMAIQD